MKKQSKTKSKKIQSSGPVLLTLGILIGLPAIMGGIFIITQMDGEQATFVGAYCILSGILFWTVLSGFGQALDRLAEISQANEEIQRQITYVVSQIGVAAEAANTAEWRRADMQTSLRMLAGRQVDG
jgi:hypothetical protein